MVAQLNNKQVEGFILKDISVSCPECQCSFSTPSVLEVPAVTEYDTIEADLHRVLPDAELRGALMAVCPHCNYATWTVRFKHSSLNPEMLPAAAEIAHSKKFALAVKHAREKMISPLEVAFIAINGLYCARESGEDADLWLELAAYEQSRGLTEESICPPTGQDYLIMAELWRQLGSFDRALEQYEIAAQDDFVPRELIDQLVMLARSGNNSPALVPPYLVRSIFPEAEEATAHVQVGKNGRPVPPVIVRRQTVDRFAEAASGPPERRTPLSSSVVGRKAPKNSENFKIELAPPPAVEVPSEVPAEVAAQIAAQSAAQAAAQAAAQPVAQAPAAASAPANAEQSLPAGAAAAAKANDTVSVHKMRDSIAQPHGASAIYLVQAAQVPQVGTVNGGNAAVGNGNGNGNGAKKGKKKPAATAAKQPAQNPLPPMDAPTDDYFSGAAPPSVSPTDRALNKAMKSKKEKTPAQEFPEIQLTDDYDDEEEDYSYDEYAADENEPAQAAQAAQSSDQSSKDFTDAIQQVESFLSLTRQSSYQSWIRTRR